MNNRSSNSSGDFPDFVTPITELMVTLATFIFEFSEFLVKKVFKIKGPAKKIDPRLLKKNRQASKSTSIGLSLNQNREVAYSEISFERHSFIVGAAGFGKTNLLSLLQENDLQEGRALIFIDPKGDLEALTTFKNICESYKRECLIFSEHYPGSIKLNPLKKGSINQIVDRIMTSFDWSEPYYKDLAYSALTYVVTELRAKAKVVSFENILSGLTKYKGAKEEHLLGLKNKLLKIATSDFAPQLVDKGEAWGFDEIRKRKACLYIGLSVQGYGETAMALGKIFFNDLLFQSYSTLIRQADSHVSMANAISIYFDEVGSLITPQFIELQNKCRGAGMRITLACQSTADINRVDPELTKQVIESADNLFIFKQRVEDSVKFLSESIGTTPSLKRTYQTDDEEKSGKGSLREVNELLVHPEVIKNLRVGQCILVRHGPTQVDLLNLRDRRRKIKISGARKFLTKLKGVRLWKGFNSTTQECKKYFPHLSSGQFSPSENSQSLIKTLE